jgi:hypothetical protein
LVVRDVDNLFVPRQPIPDESDQRGQLFGRVVFVKKAEMPARFQPIDLLG